MLLIFFPCRAEEQRRTISLSWTRTLIRWTDLVELKRKKKGDCYPTECNKEERVKEILKGRQKNSDRWMHKHSFFNYRLFHTEKKNLEIFIAITSDSLRYLILFWLTVSWWRECIASCHIWCLYCIWESDYLPSLNLDRCLFPGQLLSPECEERDGPPRACFLSPQCVSP